MLASKRPLVTLVTHRPKWGFSTRDSNHFVVVLGADGVWHEAKGRRFELLYVRATGPSQQAVADYLQGLRDGYGEFDKVHACILHSTGWVNEGREWYLPLVLVLTTAGHVAGEKLPPLARALCAIPMQVGLPKELLWR